MLGLQFIAAALLPMLALASPLNSSPQADGPIKSCTLNGGNWLDGTTSCCRQDNWRHYNGGLIACQTGKDTEKFDQCCRNKNPSAGVVEFPK